MKLVNYIIINKDQCNHQHSNKSIQISANQVTLILLYIKFGYLCQIFFLLIWTFIWQGRIQKSRLYYRIQYLEIIMLVFRWYVWASKCKD